MSVTDVLAPWAAINDALGLSAPIRDEAHYAELLAFVDEAFEQFGENDEHPIFGLGLDRGRPDPRVRGARAPPGRNCRRPSCCAS